MSEPAVQTDESKEMAEPAGSSENPAESKKEWSKELPVEAMNYLCQGKRHLLVHDYSSAVSSLQEACELFVKFYGPMAYECGDVHYNYGKALLELARQETGVLGDALEGGSDASESQENSGNSDEDAEEGDKDGTEDSAEESKADSEDAEESIESSDQGKTDSDDQAKGDGIDKSDSINAESQPGGSKTGEAGPSGSEPSNEKEEDITTLQLAWEVLETAKVIFKRHSQDSRDDQLKVAEILLALGEISLEEENFQGSLEDLQECLRIHLRYLGPDDRLLAQTYYQLGLAYAFAADYDRALDSYQRSIDVIETRIGALKTQIVPNQPTDFSLKDPAKEVEELESLLPDIKAKIEDTEELKRTPMKLLDEKEAQKKEEEEFGIPSKELPKDSKKTVTNVTHLLKRKKPEDQDSSVQPPAKKLMTVQDPPCETVTNGSSNTSQPTKSTSGV